MSRYREPHPQPPQRAQGRRAAKRDLAELEEFAGFARGTLIACTLSNAGPTHIAAAEPSGDVQSTVCGLAIRVAWTDHPGIVKARPACVTCLSKRTGTAR